MKPVLVLLLVLGYAVIASAQPPNVDAEFEKNKAKYTRENFAEGEDASSGYDYLFYRSGTEIVKIRSIWSSSNSQELRIDDMYFKNGVVLVKRMTAPKRHLANLKRGRTVPLNVVEEMHFSDAKLVNWVSAGSVRVRTDPEWSETEKQTLELAKDHLELYKDFKDR